MRNFVRLLLWPVLAVKDLLSFQVRLRRRGRRWTLQLERPMPPQLATAKARASEAFVSDLPMHTMQAELRRLLGQHREAPRFLRHLAYIERTLRLSGPEALSTLPIEVQRRGLEQLESIVMDWRAEGLAELRLRLTTLVADAQAQAQPAGFQPTNSALSDFLVSQRLQVSEESPSVFEAWQKTFRTTQPPTPADPPPDTPPDR